ncbi:50S ribosomal protein L25/general stress protein Ctc [Actinoallomurus rhizosphaericola]|uniref:50S ribosomal protein L25/general stress protein Ctc n=1 Tax=Actinoallomurus rhizosphaericola TaxID=2952536 RepID=UPI002091BA32|nr:50S ribosomal protein L25/general stress protein Ctc [Actinoallomurus rhizosphaericola]MCO5992805.1 50S ribosomal protein L25/general stress protein Ctc [Actinoallomurus rhizosphaericola]
MSEVRIAAEPRTEFGKGPARRARRAGKVPAVLYGHGTDPKHITLPGHELMLALKTPNVLLRVEGLENGAELALPKDVQRDPLKGFLEHVDLLVVKRGEKVTVEVPVQVTGEVAPGGMLDQQLVQVALEAEATHLPEAVEVDVEGLEVGTQVLAKDLKLPAGATLGADEEALVLHVLAAPTAEQIEASTTGEGEAAAAEAPAAAEGETEQSGE